MDFDSMSLEDLFKAADAITDYRSEEEQQEWAKQINEARSDLEEAIKDSLPKASPELAEVIGVVEE
jgi:hypothetical protein